MSSGILEPNFIMQSVIWDVRVYIFFPTAFLGWTFTGCFQKAQRVNILLKSKQNHSDLAKRAVLLTSHSVSTQEYKPLLISEHQNGSFSTVVNKSLNLNLHFYKTAKLTKVQAKRHKTIKLLKISAETHLLKQCYTKQCKTLAASENLGSGLAALWGNDFSGSVFARMHLTKLISDRLLRQRNGLMIYNKIERVLVITKQIFNYYNTNFSLEITSKVQKVNQKYTKSSSEIYIYTQSNH